MLDTEFCVTALEAALRHGRPEIFNTDQGAQFTSAAFTGRLEAAGVQISMDGRGRALDNVFVERLWRSVKYEEMYLKDYAGFTDAVRNLAVYFRFYNRERLHQALGYRTPAAVYRAAGLSAVATTATPQEAPGAAAGARERLQLRQQRLRLDQVARVEAFGEPGVERGEESAGRVALALALPEPRQAGGCAQLERLGLLPPGDLQGLAEERLHLLDRIAVGVEENLCSQPVELGIVEVLSLLLGEHVAESECAQGVVVAPDLPEALGEREEDLLYLRNARLALPRFDPRPASQEPSRSQQQRKPELLGEAHDFFGAFPRPVELTALETDSSSKEKSLRKTERIFQTLRQRHRLVANNQCPVGMATVHVTRGRIRAGDDATIESHRVRQRPMLVGIV
jgi:hypothetical protein